MRTYLPPFIAFLAYTFIIVWLLGHGLITDVPEPWTAINGWLCVAWVFSRMCTSIWRGAPGRVGYAPQNWFWRLMIAPVSYYFERTEPTPRTVARAMAGEYKSVIPPYMESPFDFPEDRAFCDECENPRQPGG